MSHPRHLTTLRSQQSVETPGLGDKIQFPSIESSGRRRSTKRRRVTIPHKIRTTQYLDLTREVIQDDSHVDRLAKVLRTKKKIVVVVGAGISTAAGLDDFRSESGLFASLGKQRGFKGSGKQLFDASVYKHANDTKRFHDMITSLGKQYQTAKPTRFHHMLASLANEGRLMRLYTQNIDNLDARMDPLATTVPLSHKKPWPITIQVHGSLRHMTCSKCCSIRPFNAELFDSHEPPLCDTCAELDEARVEAGRRSHGVGRLRPRVVLYNEYNPDEEAIGKVSEADLRSRPDAVLVVGTSLQTPGIRRLVKELCQATRGRRDGFTAWINTASEPKGIELKDCWDMIVKSKCDDVAELANLPRWDETEIEREAPECPV